MGDKARVDNCCVNVIGSVIRIRENRFHSVIQLGSLVSELESELHAQLFSLLTSGFVNTQIRPASICSFDSIFDAGKSAGHAHGRL